MTVNSNGYIETSLACDVLRMVIKEKACFFFFQSTDKNHILRAKKKKNRNAI